MTRVKGATHAIKHRRNVLKRAKGYMWGRSSKERMANEALVHAGNYAYRDRRNKKKDFRKLWNIKISAALAPFELSFSKFTGALRKAEIKINRKTLAALAENQPKTFEKIVEQVK